MKQQQKGRSRRLLGHFRRYLVQLEGRSDVVIDDTVCDERYVVCDAREGRESERGLGEKVLYDIVDNVEKC